MTKRGRSTIFGGDSFQSILIRLVSFAARDSNSRVMQAPRPSMGRMSFVGVCASDGEVYRNFVGVSAKPQGRQSVFGVLGA